MTRNIKQAPFAYNPIKDTSLLNDGKITKPQTQKNRLKQAVFSKTIIS